MATAKSDTGQVQEFQGQTLSPAIDYNFSWNEYENVADAQASPDWPNQSDVLKFVNTRNKTAAKAKAYAAATKELKEAYEDTPEFKRKAFIAAAVNAGMAADAAAKLADSVL